MPGTFYISLTFLNKKGIDIFNRQSMCLGIKLWFEKKKTFLFHCKWGKECC